jgi:hypothetical protein
MDGIKVTSSFRTRPLTLRNMPSIGIAKVSGRQTPRNQASTQRDGRANGAEGARVGAKQVGIGRSDLETGAFEEPPRDVGAKTPIEGLDGIPFGERDVGRVFGVAGAAATDAGLKESRGQATLPERWRHANGKDLATAVVVNGAGDREPDDQTSFNRSRDARTVADRSTDEGMSGERVGGRCHPRSEREPLPRRGVGMDDRRTADAGRRSPA